MTQYYLYLSSPENPQGWIVRPNPLVINALNGPLSIQEVLSSFSYHLDELPMIDWHGSPMASGTVLVEGKDFEMKWQTQNKFVTIGGKPTWYDISEQQYNETEELSRRIIAVPIAV